MNADLVEFVYLLSPEPLSNPSKCQSRKIRGLNLFFIILADTTALNGDRPSRGTVPIIARDISSNVYLVMTDFELPIWPDDVI